MKKAIKTDKAPQVIGPFSQAVEANGLVFVSGQIALDPKTGEFNSGSVEEQTHQVLNNLKAVLEAAEISLECVVKCNVYLKDMDDFSRMNAVYLEYFNSPFPARAAVQVVRLPMDAKIEIEAIAVKEKKSD